MPKFISYLAKNLTINELQQYFCQFSFGGTNEKNKLFVKQLLGDFLGGLCVICLFYISTSK